VASAVDMLKSADAVLAAVVADLTLKVKFTSLLTYLFAVLNSKLLPFCFSIVKV